eukprot:gnl/TRDRNA2_/TRDRNA2_174729_c2_seq2.p1 gnl/TRDRNA2_/TRDRNA2_174729_c2~~gnl/TRDRNA2_/TRDRNA2_174729_c2_seq2.p1  ORF type:complete len:539 (+),score=69.00 gnl/TRDRNA2_/TRDRNA2_174729_c2_seq2:194-1618(+)
MGSEQFVQDVQATQAVLERSGGGKRRWFRPGHALFSLRQLTWLREHHYRVAIGSIYPHDALDLPPFQCPFPRLIAWYLCRRAAAGDIIVVHDRPWTAKALAIALPVLAERFQICTLSELANACEAPGSPSMQRSHAAKLPSGRRSLTSTKIQAAFSTSSSSGLLFPQRSRDRKRTADADADGAEQPPLRRQKLSDKTSVSVHVSITLSPKKAVQSPRPMCRNDAAEMCKICYNDVAPGVAVRLACQHGWYCQECITRHTEARLEQGAVHVSCPECGIAVAEHDLRKLLPARTMERLRSRSLEQATPGTQEVRCCPTPDCSMRVTLNKGDSPQMTCPKCEKTSCLRCGKQPYHTGLTCEEYARRARSLGRNDVNEEKFQKWLKKTGTKQCPTCGTAISKQNLQNQTTQYSECHKMQCRNCETRFCFKCCAVLTENYTCGCTIDAHGFIDPKSGKIVKHLDKRRKIVRNGKDAKAR